MGPGCRPVLPFGAGGAAGGQPDALLAPDKVWENPPPQGKKSASTPAEAFYPRKGKTCDSPGFTKPGANQGFDPPALLTATDAPLAFGMVGDFSLRIAEEIPIPAFFQILTSSLVFLGRFTPCFSVDFRPVCGFQRRGGILTLPQRRKRHTGVTAAFAVFYSVGGILFRMCISSYKPGFCKRCNGFSVFLSVPQKKQNSIMLHFRYGSVTGQVSGKNQPPQLLLKPCYTCDTSLSGGGIPDVFRLFPVEIDHPLLLITNTQRTGIL